MKIFLFSTLFFFEVQFISAQEPDTYSDHRLIDYDDVQVKPEYPGGIKELSKFISKNYVIPEYVEVSGVIETSFVIETNGTISNIEIIKDLGKDTAKEAKRVISKLPKWIPGMQEDKLVGVIYHLPIKIKIDD